MRQIRYTLKEIMENEIEETPPHIPGILWKQDNVVILGDAKIGKSLLSLQLALSLTSGERFLDQYEVLQPNKVLYVQAEGKMYETFSRVKKMIKEVPFQKDNLIWLYLPAIPMDREDSCQQLLKEIGDFKPNIIFFDPLYMMATTGSLKDDDVAIKIVSNLNQIKNHFEATIILNHHQHRTKRDMKGATIEEGDDSIFGSFVWRAWPDHVMQFQKGKGGKFDRKLTCDTQRSGNVVEEMKLQLTQPDPLFFEVTSSEESSSLGNEIVKLIENTTEGLKLDELNLKFKSSSEGSIRRALRKLRLGNRIRVKDGIYSIIK